MNQRIRELAKQAKEYAINRLDETGELHKYYDVYFEKFAELIVAECLGIVDDAERGGSNDIWDNAVKFIRRDLQEHFGVEE
jgi:hypothetical protein